MITYSGRGVWPSTAEGPVLAPSIEDIAVGLGRTARFAGQTREWYPVLAHTFVVTALVRPKNRIHALLHDAPEAVVGDVPTPWKSESARINEAVLLMRIYAELGVDLPTDAGYRDLKNADRLALNAEAVVLGHTGGPHVWPRPSQRALTLTAEQFRDCRDYLEPATAIHEYVYEVRRALA